MKKIGLLLKKMSVLFSFVVGVLWLVFGGWIMIKQMETELALEAWREQQQKQQIKKVIMEMNI